MEDKIKFSVIIPTFNRATLIPMTLNSILEQTCFQFEVIVVDDGSTDNTHEAVRPYLADKRVQYFCKENSERGAARNFGISKSTGDYITFLDSDDIFLPWHFEVGAKKIREHNCPPVFHLGYEILHSDGRVDSLPVLPSPVNHKLLEGNFLSCMGVFMRRDVAFEFQFNENRALSGSEDYELWLRVAATYPIQVFPEVTSRLTNHQDRSVINTNAKKLIDRMTILENEVQKNQLFNKTFGQRLMIFASFRNLYLALHLAISGERWLAFKTLLFTVRAYPYVVFKYRFAVVIKKILLW
jgi:glycosyltransferase involved in cell wall biosynthesis